MKICIIKKTLSPPYQEYCYNCGRSVNFNFLLTTTLANATLAIVAPNFAVNLAENETSMYDYGKGV